MTTGTEGNDTLTNDPTIAYEIVDALGGDDTITVQRPDDSVGGNESVTVHGGDGIDTLVLSGTIRASALSAEGGSFTFYVHSTRDYEVAYDGIERIHFTGNLHGPTDFVTGDTQDELHLQGGEPYFAEVRTGGGDDRITLTGEFINVEIYTGDGNDYVDASVTNSADPYTPYFLYGEAGDDRLIGSIGVTDYLFGGTGDDTMTVSDPKDVVVENAGEGIDTVISIRSGYELGANVENLILSGHALLGAAISGYGNELANTITGNDANNLLYGRAGDDTILGGAGNDQLDGGAGSDVMAGGTGHDSYWVESPADTVIEAAGEGTDKVFSTFSYTLGANVENLQLLGSADIAGYGNALANVITGNSGINYIKTYEGNDRLDGGAGADYLLGGAGDDTYFVDHSGEHVFERAGEGDDLVYSSVSFDLGGQHLERLRLTGTADIAAIGNSLNNALQGNVGNNVLDGQGGADAMAGGLGNDTYYVDHAGDSVIESLYGGYDQVFSSVTYYISETYEIESVTLTGTGNTRAYGNSSANRLEGNSGDNFLDGRAGADRMIGGDGNDTYVVDQTGDRVYETSLTGGYDTVLSAVTFSLASTAIERLQLTGGADIDAVGNSLANALIGNGGANRLYGGLGNDTLEGGGGADGFFFNTRLGASNVDDILDFSVADDTIHLDRSIFTQAGPNGTLAASAFHTGTSAQDADDRIVYDSATGNIFYDADGSGAGAAVLFATVDAGTLLTSADFIVYG